MCAGRMLWERSTYESGSLASQPLFLRGGARGGGGKKSLVT